MTLIRFKPATRQFPVFPSLLENFFNNDLSHFADGSRGTMPSANISEDKDGYHIDIAAPGMEKDDFKIEVEQNVLVITANHESQSEEKENSYTRKEFSCESFQRSFTLPESADADNISASYTKGILGVSIPKKEEAKLKPARQILIS